MVGEQRLAESGGVRGHQRADLKRLAAVVGAEDVVHDQHLILVERADADALAAPSREPVRPIERAGAQLVAIEVARAHVQQRRAELVLPRLAVLLDEPDQLQRAQDSVDGSLGEPQFAGKLSHRQPARAPRKQPQDRGRALDGLDPPGQLCGAQKSARKPDQTMFDIVATFPLLSQRSP